MGEGGAQPRDILRFSTGSSLAGSKLNESLQFKTWRVWWANFDCMWDSLLTRYPDWKLLGC